MANVAEQTLQVEYDGMDNVIRQNDELREMAEDIKDRLVRQTEECRDGGLWTGKGADAYYQEFENDILPALNRLTGELTEASPLLNQMKSEAEEAEGQVSAAFQEMMQAAQDAIP